MASKTRTLKRISDGGVIGTSPVTHGVFVLVTNDAEAAIETDGYLDDDAERFTPGIGDILLVAGDRDGTPVGLIYLVTRVAGDIALTAFKGTA